MSNDEQLVLSAKLDVMMAFFQERLDDLKKDFKDAIKELKTDFRADIETIKTSQTQCRAHCDTEMPVLHKRVTEQGEEISKLAGREELKAEEKAGKPHRHTANATWILGALQALTILALILMNMHGAQ